MLQHAGAEELVTDQLLGGRRAGPGTALTEAVRAGAGTALAAVAPLVPAEVIVLVLHRRCATASVFGSNFRKGFAEPNRYWWWKRLEMAARKKKEPVPECYCSKQFNPADKILCGTLAWIESSRLSVLWRKSRLR